MAGFLNRWSKKKLGAEPELSPSELAEKQLPAQLKKSADTSAKDAKDSVSGEQSSEKKYRASGRRGSSAGSCANA